MEKTLVLVKPDGVQKGLIGEIIKRFERRGLKVIGLKMLVMSEKQATQHYQEHVGKAFFSELVSFITSGPLVSMILEGNNAVKIVRTMMGTTNPAEAAPGTIRGDFALTMSNNVIHGSDGIECANREISIFFSEDEIFGGKA